VRHTLTPRERQTNTEKETHTHNLEGETHTFSNITKLKLKIEKLRLYLKVITNNEITLRNITTFELEYKNEDFNKHLHPLFGSVKDNTELSNYLESPLNPQQKILEKALDEHKKGDIFNSFPKLINWLDDNAGKGSSRFCCVRDVCSHGKTDDAIHKVNQKFPNEFEFDDGIFNMDSQQNLQNLNMHLPEVFSQIEKTFLEKYV